MRLPYGIYVHFPYCAHRCPYCDFAVTTDPVPEDVKQERLDRFMELAARISAEKLAAKVGRRMRVLVDEVNEGGAVARSMADAPEIDGIVRIARPGKGLKAGDWADVQVTGADAYDLAAKIVKPTK